MSHLVAQGEFFFILEQDIERSALTMSSLALGCKAGSDHQPENTNLDPSFAHIGLKIPEVVRTQILPNQKLSVLELLQYPLPTVSTATDIILVATYFSSQQPDITDEKIIQTIPLPPVS